MRAWPRVAPRVSVSVNTYAGEAILPTQSAQLTSCGDVVVARRGARADCYCVLLEGKQNIQRNCQCHGNVITIILNRTIMVTSCRLEKNQGLFMRFRHI